MKITVNRELKGGVFYVSFRIGDFTPDELQKMQSFGVPSVPIKAGVGPKAIPYILGVNQVSEKFKAGFSTEEEAKQYEDGVLSRVREEMKQLRERTDNFTSTAEVDI